MDNRTKQALFSSARDDWATPQDFFNALNAEFSFELDVAADDINHKCQRYYTECDDGLSQPWYGIVWCNPPYGRNVGTWVQKAYQEHHSNGCCVVMLLPARTDTKWFHDYIYGKAEIRFVRGRLKFGGCKNAAPFPSMVVVYGDNNG